MEPSLSSTFCFPNDAELSSSSSSSSKIPLVAPPFLIAPNAAFPPANENGVDCTAVPKTDAEDGALNAAKFVVTLRGGELVGDGILEEEDGDPNFLASVGRAGDGG
jgi:hypothetical protein